MATLTVGDIGAVLTCTITSDGTTAIDISGATVKTIHIEKPDGTDVAKAAAFTTTGSDGKIYYAFIAGDLNQAGTYRVQPYIEMPGFKFRASPDTFDVRDAQYVPTT